MMCQARALQGTPLAVGCALPKALEGRLHEYEYLEGDVRGLRRRQPWAAESEPVTGAR